MTQSSPSVLIVEDEALILMTAADDLREAGFTVFEASDASEAVHILELHPEIGVIFTDIDMPGTIDGLRLSAIVRDRWPPIKIIITSGKQRPTANMMPHGGFFIPKPYVTSHVAKAIRSLIGELR